MNNLFDLRTRQWNLILSPPRKRLLIAISLLAHTADLIVLDCGRQFDSSVVARAARGRREIIDRINVQRAFTCHEAVKLLERTPGGGSPVLVLDFLSTFHDENVKMHSRAFLLETAIRQFHRLSRGAGLAVSVYPPPASPDSVHLFERLQSAAPHVSNYDVPVRPPAQLSLF